MSVNPGSLAHDVDKKSLDSHLSCFEFEANNKFSGVASGPACPAVRISLLKHCFIYLEALKIYHYHIVIAAEGSTLFLT